ncbi:hypothetical protein MKW92_013225 [Papaver armeniacum]|nr:hypothetical protein MKW92_013225 [Papaver armeniacum]
MVQLMLVFAPAGCILAGLALDGAFDVITSSVKFQLPGLLLGDSDVYVVLVFLVVRPAFLSQHLLPILSLFRLTAGFLRS